MVQAVPAPNIATLSPGFTRPRWHAYTHTDSGSHMAPSSRDTLAGNLKEKSDGWTTKL